MFFIRRTIIFSILLSVILLILSPPSAYGQYDRSYYTYLEAGKESLKRKDYKTALFYFDSAHNISPDKKEARRYMNLINRLMQGKVKKVEAIKKYKRRVFKVPPIEPGKKPLISTAPKKIKREVKPREEALKVAVEPDQAKTKRIILLDDQLWGLQPDTTIEIEIRKSVILRNRFIERFLVFEEGFIDIEKLDSKNLRLTAKKRGSTFLHIWDNRGRWTFNIKIIFPKRALTPAQISERALEVYEKPFKIEYSGNWASFYRGNSMRELARENLTFRQWVGIFGDSPYGKLDGSLNFYKFDDSTEIVGKTIGLTDGKIGPFNDFNIRGYDAFKEFSELSLPGRYFSGGLLEAYAFHRNIKYSLFRGQDRATFTFLAPEVYELKKSYLEGAKVTLFPDKSHRVSINYARGYGEVRPVSYKDKVFSIDTYHKFKDLSVITEIAYDEDETAYLFRSHLVKDRHSLRFNVRDINKDFNTITGRPTQAGEVGGNILYDYRSPQFQFRANLDAYRDREIFNPDSLDEVNFELNSSVNVPLSNTSRVDSSVYYRYTPQLVSPQNSFGANASYSKDIKIFGNRRLTFHVGNSYQQSRFDLAPASEYDIYGVRAGFRVSIINNLSYNLNYNFNWVDDISNDEISRPNVLTTGISYSWQLTDNLSGNLNFSYRDEENTSKSFSFLAGEDNITGNISLNYRPVPEMEIFLDGRVRNVWAENAMHDAYNELDIRCGLRTSWDAFFRWDPQGTIAGKVFKDFNGNSIQDEEEPGIPGIKINVGKKTVKTDILGEYQAQVRAKRVRVVLDAGSIPRGYVLSTALSKDIYIKHRQTSTVNFGLTTRSGIYGVVYFDKNENGELDPDDVLVPKTEIILDGKIKDVSGSDGSYFFENVAPGKHIIKVEINSLPLEYLPLIKLENEVDVEEGTTYVLHVPLRRQE